MSKIIKLTRGYESIVDDEDYDRLIKMGKWNIMRKGKNIYARRNDKKATKSITLMHRLILDAPKDLHIDHINGNGLDNRKINLRFCTASQNQMNRTSVAGSSSRFKGVHWHIRNKKWQAQIALRGRYYYLGIFDNEIDAAIIYDEAAKILHGNFAQTNF